MRLRRAQVGSGEGAVGSGEGGGSEVGNGSDGGDGEGNGEQGGGGSVGWRGSGGGSNMTPNTSPLLNVAPPPSYAQVVDDCKKHDNSMGVTTVIQATVVGMENSDGRNGESDNASNTIQATIVDAQSTT